MRHETVHSQSYATCFRHSAVLSVSTVLLRKLPNVKIAPPRCDVSYAWTALQPDDLALRCNSHKKRKTQKQNKKNLTFPTPPPTTLYFFTYTWFLDQSRSVALINHQAKGGKFHAHKAKWAVLIDSLRNRTPRRHRTAERQKNVA